jgi:hypothetical protein
MVTVLSDPEWIPTPLILRQRLGILLCHCC